MCVLYTDYVLQSILQQQLYIPALYRAIIVTYIIGGGHSNISVVHMKETQKETPKPGGVLDFGLDGGVPPGPRDTNPCLEVKKVPMFRDFAPKMDPCLGIFLSRIITTFALRAQNIFVILTKKWTHV